MNAIAFDRLLELQRRFLAGLDRRLAEMTALLDGTAGAEALMRMFHSLAGIGGTYGFPRITEISLECDSVCARAMEERRAMTPAEARRIRDSVANIRAAAEATSGSRTTP